MIKRRLSAGLHSNVASVALCLSITLLGTGCVTNQTTKASDAGQVNSQMANAASSKKADAAKDMADWVVRSKDNQNMPFAIVDKVEAKVYVYDVDGRLYGEAPVLLGMAKGDRSVPGIGDKPLSQIPPSERITPAGRFVAQMGRNHKGKEILWVDYNEALSMHPVVNVPQQRRPQRLASLTTSDNRISYGCINVPKQFFKDVIHTNLSGTSSVVYILPETKKS